MLKLKDDGYVYISDKGIEYELLEGMSIGVEPRFTSDFIFIMLCSDEYNVDNLFVDYLFGARAFESNPSSYEGMIKRLVDEYEKREFGIIQIARAIRQKIEMGYDKAQLEVDFGELDECEGYYLSKVNGFGTTPITPILAVEGDFKDDDLIAKLEEMNIAYNL